MIWINILNKTLKLIWIFTIIPLLSDAWFLPTDSTKPFESTFFEMPSPLATDSLRPARRYTSVLQVSFQVVTCQTSGKVKRIYIYIYHLSRFQNLCHDMFLACDACLACFKYLCIHIWVSDKIPCTSKGHHQVGGFPIWVYQCLGDSSKTFKCILNLQLWLALLSIVKNIYPYIYIYIIYNRQSPTPTLT